MPVTLLTLPDRSLAYQRQIGAADKPGIVFLGGFASDMTGAKASYLADFCAEKNISYVRFDYRGCGQSPGNFRDGTLGGWLEDALAILDALTKGPQIIIGSSMGGWLGMLLAQARPEQVKALIGVAAAPDFTETLVWERLTNEQRAALLRDGEIIDPDDPPDHRLPMSLRLIEEARAHLVFARAFSVPCPVRLLQGKKDTSVPWEYADKIAAHLGGDIKVAFIENGDHRLSTPEDLPMLGRMIEEFL